MGAEFAFRITFDTRLPLKPYSEKINILLGAVV